MEGVCILKIKRVDEQGYALSEEDMDIIKGTELCFTMMQNRIIVSSRGFDESLLQEISATNFYHVEQIHKKHSDDEYDYVYRFWFASPVDKESFMNILAMKKLGQDV